MRFWSPAGNLEGDPDSSFERKKNWKVASSLIAGEKILFPLMFFGSWHPATRTYLFNQATFCTHVPSFHMIGGCTDSYQNLHLFFFKKNPLCAVLTSIINKYPQLAVQSPSRTFFLLLSTFTESWNDVVTIAKAGMASIPSIPKNCLTLHRICTQRANEHGKVLTATFLLSRVIREVGE